MVRDNSNDLSSNPLSWPIIAFQHNDFKEGYFNGSLSVHHGRHEWKAGVESDATFLHENFSDTIPHCASSNPNPLGSPQCPIVVGIFDVGTPTSFAFTGSRPDLEQSAYVQDAIRLGNWTVNAGLRWDHYQLLVNQNAVSPRLSVARYFPSTGVNLHASYDRIFQTPSFENILLSSSTAVQSLNPSVLRLPVQPSHGNYYEAGIDQSVLRETAAGREHVPPGREQLRRRRSDSEHCGQLPHRVSERPLSTGRRQSSKCCTGGAFRASPVTPTHVGNAWFPVTGGLFLGE